ncbi:hypothetical protein HHI36_002309 [Cryptolaemus montrouzieri]|uniref:Uncharacterized protein n=1 Tax=Cryptolaemus montrouzieri TaxID=559131 RepID=A0ABD2PA44_9CUCU
MKHMKERQEIFKMEKVANEFTKEEFIKAKNLLNNLRKEIAKEYNNYFAGGLRNELADKIETMKHKNFSYEEISESIFLESTNLCETRIMLSDIRNHSSLGRDDVTK